MTGPRPTGPRGVSSVSADIHLENKNGSGPYLVPYTKINSGCCGSKCKRLNCKAFRRKRQRYLVSLAKIFNVGCNGKEKDTVSICLIRDLWPKCVKTDCLQVKRERQCRENVKVLLIL